MGLSLRGGSCPTKLESHHAWVACTTIATALLRATEQYSFRYTKYTAPMRHCLHWTALKLRLAAVTNGSCGPTGAADQ